MDNLYDFEDVSDLPEDMQEALAPRTSEDPALVSELADIVNGAPKALKIRQIMAVATRKGLELPNETTVRNYLNKSVETGVIVKPTRQTYAPGIEAA